ncbi:hypothetical protein HUT19_19125 [Streptomyces sp. NA02950]|uniref:hypothetical protein n=1 Tax=Streptomyces sp. NA02950 TaxID=2742137 RepID=UPI00158FC378|nr:hypothetical protein [Streptomyces sp. NA02950]QKV93609.1 hypothetical protein HUT19_19125 [Streptomyces sp. NA02950]
MFRPKYPETPTLPTVHLPGSATPATQRPHAPAACGCQHTSAPAPRRTPLLGLNAGTVGAVVTVGIVLTALLAAVAVTAISVAVAAVVMRSLLTGQRRR